MITYDQTQSINGKGERKEQRWPSAPLPIASRYTPGFQPQPYPGSSLKGKGLEYDKQPYLALLGTRCMHDRAATLGLR